MELTPMLAVFGLGPQELIIILVIVVLLFGARRIPELARGLGEGVRGFRSSLKGEGEDSTEDPQKPTET